MYDISQRSLKSVLENKSFNKSIVNEIASVACLSNYGQSVEINGFVGVISLAGTVGELWAIKGGNKQVPLKLLEKSGATLVNNTLVKYVGKDKENPDFKNVIIYQKGEEDIYDNSFDYVIISFPIHNKIENFNLDFDSYHKLVEMLRNETKRKKILKTWFSFPRERSKSFFKGFLCEIKL